MEHSPKDSAGDYLLCYITGLMRFIGILEVLDAPYKDDSRIWKDEEFPCRLKVQVKVELTPNTAVPVLELKDRLSFFKDLVSPHAWTGHFRTSPAKWLLGDGEAITSAMMDAKANPVTSRLLKNH